MAIPGIPELPQMPTDNLYKFVSLSGVLMLLVGFAVPAVVRYRAMEVELALLAQYESRAARHSQALNQFSNAIDLMGRPNSQEFERRQAEATTDLARLENRLAQIESRPLPHPNLQASPRQTTGIPDASASDASRHAEATADSAQVVLDSLETHSLAAAERVAETEKEFFAFVAWAGFALAFAGTLLAAWGFRNWYIRLQKPLDDIVRHEAEGRGDRKTPYA
jgi:hypothetical protein